MLGGPTEHTVPLRSYFDPGQGDHLTVCSPQGVEDARVAGYQPIRIEGHVFLSAAIDPGSTPLRLYASGARHDNLLSGTPRKRPMRPRRRATASCARRGSRRPMWR